MEENTAAVFSPTTTDLRRHIRKHLRCDENLLIDQLLPLARFSPAEQQRIFDRARPLIDTVRAARHRTGSIDAFMHTYALSSHEGIVLMCLAEALLRIPDTGTQDRLIRDKIGPADWEKYLGESSSVLVNASTWGLLLTGHMVRLELAEQNPRGILKRLLARLGEPVIRQAVLAGMRMLGQQFVMGRTINEALDRASTTEAAGYRHSYDMLGESARTARDARRYFDSYAKAIVAIGHSTRPFAAGEESTAPELRAPSISVKLSALHPRYEVAQQQRVGAELTPTLKALALTARQAGVGFTIDAEEADRLELSLDLIAALAIDPELAGWNGLGLAVQAYQKRALPVIDWLAELAHRARRRLMVRLVKGAYWDTEIKRAQERGLSDYPVFTRKVSTDVSYLACARRLLAEPEAFYPAFATHNAHTISAIAEMASAVGSDRGWEYQRLYGMGDELYDQVVGNPHWPATCRIYAPVGSHRDLLAYLVRRLLENGANSSFVNHIADANQPLSTLLADPAETMTRWPDKRSSRIPLPRDLFRTADTPAGSQRLNSEGRDLDDSATLDRLATALASSRQRLFSAAAVIDGLQKNEPDATLWSPVRNPANHREVVGHCLDADHDDLARAMASAARAQPGWDATPATKRASMLEAAAALAQQRMDELIALIVRESGRTLADATSEVRETIDFLRYYAAEARHKFAAPLRLPGPTGEENTLHWHGRGTFVCISPWNFPLAIFTGQIAAALAAGNAVVAKPAEQTPLIGRVAIDILHQGGIPAGVLHFLPGAGNVGAALVADRHCCGVAFTGSTGVARQIARALADRSGPLVPLIAETGGQNALIADSSALPEQLVRDVIASAFNSAGQRCSALRVLFVQDDIADRVCEMLAGAMQELRLGDPAEISTDIGPVIDRAACAALEAHATYLESFARRIHVDDTQGPANGTFFPPRAYEIDALSRLDHEVFGPILHVIRWPAEQLDAVCDAIAATGYGLTLGIHSRIDGTVKRITERLHVGNIYVNRNQIGAVVGAQPFGGEGLSGTGPKAGGPHYLYRFACERTISVDTTAAGGNARLMANGE